MNSSDENAENLLFLDIEASGLRRGSFPIEVGVAWLSIVDIGSRAELIEPAPHWNRSSWSPDSEAVHGISRGVLACRGRPAEEVGTSRILPNMPFSRSAAEFILSRPPMFLKQMSALKSRPITN